MPEEPKDPIPRKHLERQRNGKHGQILFYRAIPATAEDPTSTNAVDWHLKVKDI